jgi:hypothetical protein
MTNPRDTFTEQLAHLLPGLTEAETAAVLNLCELYYTAATHAERTGPALTYTHSDGKTLTDVDRAPVSVDDTAPNRRRERALCRALLVEALRLMDTTEPTTATCGTIRTERQWYDGDRRTFGAAADWPCVLTPAHSGDHVDKDGDTFQ